MSEYEEIRRWKFSFVVVECRKVPRGGGAISVRMADHVTSLDPVQTDEVIKMLQAATAFAREGS